MASQYQEQVGLGVALLESCPAADKKALAASTLVKLLTNLVEKPQEDKFRRIRVTNQAIRERVMEVPGGEALLLAAGFVREGEFMVVPSNTDTTRAAAVLTQLQSSSASAAGDGCCGGGGCGSGPTASVPSTTARRPSASLSSSSSGVGSEEYKARAAQLAAEKRAKDAAKEDLRKQLERDKKERAAAQAHMAARTQGGGSVAVQRQFGAKPTCFKDVGVDLNKKGG